MHDQVSRPTGFLPAGIVSIGPSGWLFDGSGRANSMLSPPSVLTASPAPGGKLPKSTPFDSCLYSTYHTTVFPHLQEDFH